MNTDWNGAIQPSRSKAVRGGIKARSRKGDFGGSWWARRWIAVLESFDLGDRLARGRNYARQGRVLDIRIEKGKVTANVQGSRSRPYTVVLRIAPIQRREWLQLSGVLDGRALYRVKLLAGEMPEDLEELFRGAGVSLFPEQAGDLVTSCSCPDWSNPCTHVAAVYYLLAEEFDRDPFLLLRLRGIERESLLGTGGAAAAPPAKAAAAKAPPAPAERCELPEDAEVFWGRKPPETDPASAPPPELSAAGPGEAAVPALPAALPRQLGVFPFWRGEEDFLKLMERVYEAASRLGVDMFSRLAAPEAGESAGGTDGEPASGAKTGS